MGSTVKVAPGCPVCGAQAAADYKPFCSHRCADVDLNRWLSGVYRVPSQAASMAKEEGEDAPVDALSGRLNSPDKGRSSV